jgi:folylpolyglutamate synthase/dihydropteroate synthase
MNELLYGLALDPQITSLTAPGAGRDSKWQRRAELFRKQACTDPVVLFDGAFAPELQNAWANTIQKMFNVFGIIQPALYDARVKQYM